MFALDVKGHGRIFWRKETKTTYRPGWPGSAGAGGAAHVVFSKGERGVESEVAVDPSAVPEAGSGGLCAPQGAAPPLPRFRGRPCF